MAKLIRFGGEPEAKISVTLPPFLQREEIAAQIVALMQAKFTRPGPEEMLEILKCAEQQVTALQLQPSLPSSRDNP
jgi:hypothetical protein